MSADLDGWVLVERPDGTRFIEREVRPGVFRRIHDPNRTAERTGTVIAGQPVHVSARQPRPPLAILSEGAHRSIVRAVSWATDGKESGGLLYGKIDANGTIVVERAIEASTERGPFHVRLDMRRTTGRLDDLLLGDWHSHGKGSGRPSEQDTESWRRLAVRARADGLPFVVSVIVETGRFDRDPKVHGYATTWRGRTNEIPL